MSRSRSPVLSDGDVVGGQLAGLAARAGSFTGAQVSAAMNTAERATGLQLSLVNVADDLEGVQLGLVNVNRNGRIPVLPLFNFGF